MSMPAALAEVVSDFKEVQGQDKLQLLLEFANELPPLPADLEEAAMEPVPECQSPLFLHVDEDLFLTGPLGRNEPFQSKPHFGKEPERFRAQPDAPGEGFHDKSFPVDRRQLVGEERKSPEKEGEDESRLPYHGGR